MKKRALTLLEIMIVIFLITLVTGTIGYSMRGTLEKGRVFKTEQAKEQLHDLLLICLAEEGNADAIAKDPGTYLKKLGLAKDPDGLLKDGWNEDFQISVLGNDLDFKIRSEALERYRARQK
jgi:general secretion pathway protein G